MRWILVLLSLLAVMALLIGGCKGSSAPITPSTPDEGRGIGYLPDEFCGDATTVRLIAGQNIDVGEVIVTNDENYLYIEYVTTPPWVLVETHVSIEDSLSGIPQNKPGNPTVGKFAYNIDSFVPLTWESGKMLYVAAHAKVRKLGADGAVLQEETAWGKGFGFPGKNWAMYFNHMVQPCVSNNPPVWDGPVGIQSATPGDAGITVEFGNATDPDGDTPVTYDLYYVDETDTGNTDPFNSPYVVVPNVTSPYLLTGLTNDHTYWLGVRAKDSKGLSETNTEKKSATPSAPVINNPPIWDGPVGIQSATPGDAIITIEFRTATDPDGDTPVTYDLYYVDETDMGNTDPFNWPNVVEPNITSPYNLTGLTNNHTYWLGVRAKDSKGLSETNTEKKSATPEPAPSDNLVWAKRAGGLDNDYGRGITTLSDNSTVVTGFFYGSATFGESESNQTVLTSAGGWDIFIARYNPDGTLAWAKRAGGIVDNDYGYAITTLSDDSTVVTGCFEAIATFGPGEPNEIVLKSEGTWGANIFVARYNPDGTLSWAKRAGGDLQSNGSGITALSDNSTVVTGTFYGDATFGQGESNEKVLWSTSFTTKDIFIARYNPDGTIAWAKRAGGLYGDSGIGITTLSDNSTVVTGYFQGTATFGPGEANEKVLYSNGYADIFIARYNPDGTLSWAKRAGGPSYYYPDGGNGITTLSDNTIVVTGWFYGYATFGPGEPNEKVLYSAGVDDIFIARYNPDGTLAWAKCAGGSVHDYGFGITTLSDNSTVVTGEFWGSAAFGPGESNQTVLTSAGYEDIFIARYNPDGTLSWAKRAGGTDTDVGNGITTLSDNSTVVTGSFRWLATFGPGETNQTVLTSAGNADIFIARFAP